MRLMLKQNVEKQEFVQPETDKKIPFKNILNCTYLVFNYIQFED